MHYSFQLPSLSVLVPIRLSAMVAILKDGREGVKLFSKEKRSVVRIWSSIACIKSRALHSLRGMCQDKCQVLTWYCSGSTRVHSDIPKTVVTQ